MLALKSWHYLNYKGHFYLCVQRKTNAFLDAYGSFCKFQEVSQSCNMFRLIHMYPAEAKVNNLLLTIIFCDCVLQKSTSGG